MGKGKFFIIAFFFLFLLSLAITWNELQPSIPGWHTPIYPKFVIPSFLVSFILLSETIIYWRIDKKHFLVNPYFFFVHILFTIPIILMGTFPALFYSQRFIEYNGYSRLPGIFSAAYFMFAVMRIVFCIVVLRVLLSGNTSRLITYQW
jgi:hypothetical protein